MRSLIIHNLDAGFGSSVVFEFERELLKRGDECVVRAFDVDVPAAELLSDAEDFDRVVVSGGDGTATNALYALRNRNIPTCIYPSGTANLLFANLGNASEPHVIAESCRTGQVRALDLGEIRWTDERGEGHVEGFGIMAGMGFDAQIMQSATANKQAIGEAAYFTAVLANLNPTIATFKITVDGVMHERKGISCIVANAGMIQGDINILPGCRMDDGVLDVMVLATTDAVGLIVPILAGIIDPLGETIGRPNIERFSGREIRVESSEPLHLQRDGDPEGTLVTGYEVSCLPSSNLIVVDKNSPYFER